MTLDPHAAAVADAFLDEQAVRRDHLVVALSGAHAYGFPSPDSDLDLKAVHVAPTRTLLGLGTPEQVADRLEVIEGVEVDYTSNEIGGVISGILAGNGNYLERICGALLLRRDPDLDELQVLTRAALSRRFHHHYRGFAKAQRKALDRTQAASTKKALYVLRTALTGRHLLETGELVVDVRELHDRYGFPDAAELIARKMAGETVSLAEADLERWRSRLDDAIAALDDARLRSPLPDEAPNQPALDDWLITLRRRRDA